MRKKFKPYWAVARKDYYWSERAVTKDKLYRITEPATKVGFVTIDKNDNGKSDIIHRSVFDIPLYERITNFFKYGFNRKQKKA